jgi:DNA-binding SARP family transcriptional activator
VLDFRILGPLEVVGEDGPVTLGGPKQRATLAILLLHANRVVSIDRLADDLYAGAPPVTAVTQVRRQVSDLRRTLGSAAAIETRSPGYILRVVPDQLDLSRFERGAEEASQALRSGDLQLAARRLHEALSLWRGTPLADLAYESFAQNSIERLEEIRLAALEQRLEAELALGRHAGLVAELEDLVAEHPLRECLLGQLMLALYRSGRQVEALDVYRRTRETLVEEFGLEPSRALEELERAILAQDPTLDLARATPAHAQPLPAPDRAVLVLPRDDDELDVLLALAEPLAKLPARELIVARLVRHESELVRAASELEARRAALGVSARAAALTTLEPARDVARLASTHEVELVLLDASVGLDEIPLPQEFAAILDHSPADVAVLTKSAGKLQLGDGLFVLFGGSEHDWAALELGAWLAFAAGAPLRLVGLKADPRRGRRDASRLLAEASLAVQRVVGVAAQPLLAEPTEEALIGAVEAAALVVVGISERWRREGIGAARRALVRDARPSTLLVHHGPRPGGLAPRETRTRFSWSIEA